MPANEQERLRELQELYILDTLPEADFDDITRLAAEISQTPVSLVGLIDAERQWFKSKHGIEADEISREQAFCTHTISAAGEPLIVNDLSKDDRFRNNPLVTGDPHILFYAGFPLVTHSGHAVGTLCVWDHAPKKLSDQQVRTLKALAHQLVTQLELRKKILQVKRHNSELQRAYADLEKFSSIASHDLKSPLNNIISITHLLKDGYGAKLDHDGNEYIDYLNTAAYELSGLVSGILHYSRSSQITMDNKECFGVTEIIEEVKKLLQLKPNCTVTYDNGVESIYTSRIAVKQILLNLIQNGIKYNDKENIIIGISASEDLSYYHFTVTDNGMGIAEEHLDKIFDLFETVDKSEGHSTGIGLAVVKRLVEKLGGEISVTSTPGSGTTFSFTISK